MLGDANPAKAVPVAETKAEMDSLAIAARKSVLERVKLADVRDVLKFRLADDLIDQLRRIGRLSLRLAANAQQA
jgi:phosphate:Na+ symporter